MDRWTTNSIPDQTGRTLIVTGANSGLGYETTKELARRGAHVIMAVRNEAKGREALATLRAAQPDASLELRRLDLADLDSVRAFAESIISDQVPVHVLINNAGIMMPPRSLTKQGFESQFGANHLGHFALTALLLDTVKAADEGRVVTVSSMVHKGGGIHFDDLTGDRAYSPSAFYSQSKFANVLFGLELDRRLRAGGLPVKSILAHPGYSSTNLVSTGPTGLRGLVMKYATPILAQSASMGALPQLYAATDPNAQSGQFIGPDRMGESRGYPTLVQPVGTAKDPETAAWLWQRSEELTGVQFALAAAA
jgi:NAD(P)-dependent dehydrogenase (short-subunit alcohol dehydrogenase family)